MLNKIFASEEIFKNSKPTDVFVAIPVDVFSIETTSRSVEDNFISNTIINLKNIGLTLPEIAEEMSLDKTLVKQFLDSQKERDDVGIKNQGSISQICYIFYDKNSQSVINEYCTSEQYQKGIHLPNIVDESQNLLKIKESLSSSVVHDVYVLRPNDNNIFEPTIEDIKKAISYSRNDNQIVDFTYVSKEETIYIITKIYFCEKNQNRFFIYDYFGKFSDNPSLYDSIKKALPDNHGLDTKIKNCQNSFLRYYNERMKMNTNNSLKEEFNIKQLEAVGLKQIANIVFNNYEKLMSAQRNGSRDIEKYIYSLASSTYDSFEHLFEHFIVQHYSEATIDRFNELLNSNEDAIGSYQIIRSYLTKQYYFAQDSRNDRAFKAIDGYRALEETLNKIEPNDSEDIKQNLFNFIFISLIIIEEDHNLYGKINNFALRNPYFFEQLLVCKNMRISNRHDLDKNGVENSFKFVIKMFNNLVYFIHLLFAIGKGNKVIEKDDAETINYRADIGDELRLDIKKGDYYKKYQKFVDDLEVVFRNRTLGTEALDIPYNIFTKINETLLKYMVCKYVSIETINYTGEDGVAMVNANITTCGSTGIFENEVKKNTTILTKENYKERAYQRFTFVSTLGMMSEKEPEILSSIFDRMPELVFLYEHFVKLRQHNNQVDNEQFYIDNFEYYQTLINYLRFASDLEYLSIMED